VIDAGGRAAGRTRLFGIALVATLLVSLLPLPWRLTGLVFGVLCAWTGVRLIADLVALRRAGRRPGGMIGVSVGIGVSVMLLLSYLGEAALYPLVAERERCDSGAVTHLAADQCRRSFDRGLRELVDRIQGTRPGPG
jgi:hypothetical protein